MVTHYPQQIASRRPHTERETGPADEGFGTRVMDVVRQAYCALHGHDDLLQFEHDRMFLKCVSCGHESPGWELTEPRPHALPTAVRDDVRQPRVLARPHFVDARRIA